MGTSIVLFPLALCALVAAQGAEATAEGAPPGHRTANTLSFDSSSPRPRAAIGDVAWIAGHWTGEALGGVSEEIWSQPRDGGMMGMYRLVKDGGPAFYELLTISEDSGSLILRLKHFHADLKGWEERDEVREFPLVEIATGEASFDGMTFVRQSADEIQIYLAIEQDDGTAREEVFAYRRAPATPAGSPSPGEPCGAAMTTKDIVDCLAEELSSRTKELQQLDARLRGILDSDQIALLDRASSSWLVYRQAACTAAAGLYQRGSLAPVASSGCYIQLTGERIASLRATYRNELRQDG